MKGEKVRERVVYIRRYYKILFTYTAKVAVNNLYVIHHFIHLTDIHQALNSVFLLAQFEKHIFWPIQSKHIAASFLVYYCFLLKGIV